MTQIPKPLSGVELSENEQVGWEFFWRGAPCDYVQWTDEAVRGWWMGHVFAYGQGVKAACREATSHAMGWARSEDNPYPQFSGAWEAWGAGNDAMEEL